jgi:uncharacterized protein (TIGR00645 family)
MDIKTNPTLIKLRKTIEIIIFSVRWVLPIFYLVLFVSLLFYAYFDIHEFVEEYIYHFHELNKTSAMLVFIELIDIVMISNLGKMCITGSYNSFVSKLHGYKNENISSGLLKVKMSTSLVGVTAIALLQKCFIVDKLGNLITTWDTLYKLGFVHGLFLLASIVLEIVDFLHEKVELSEGKHQLEEAKFKLEKEKFVFEKIKLNIKEGNEELELEENTNHK